MSQSARPQVAISSERISDRTVWTFIRLREDGCTGIGEATLEGRHAAVEAAIHKWGVALSDRFSPLDNRSLSWIGQQAQSAPSLVEATALSGLEQALQDLLAQKAGRSLHQCLGHARRDLIPLYANINRGTVPRTPQRFAERALRAASQGFSAVKLAPFDGVDPANASGTAGRALIDTGLARIAAVRDALASDHPDVEIMVDCHWRFDEATARDMVRELASLGVTWYECPVPETSDHHAVIKTLRVLSNAAGMRLAGAETMIGLAGFEPFLRGGLYDVVMPDVKHAGGVSAVLEIARASAALGIACSPHNPTGPICHAHSLHAAALIDNMPCLEVQFEESDRFFSLADDRLPRFLRGTSALPAGPGLGVGLLT
jgi:galactonate dehydratase